MIVGHSLTLTLRGAIGNVWLSEAVEIAAPAALKVDFDLSVTGSLLRPGEDCESSPGQELLGVITSHGPFRESYRSSRKSSRSAEAFGTPATDTAVSAQRLRPALSSPAGPPALLQRWLPAGGAEVVAMEGTATIPQNEGRQAATERPKPALSGAGPKPETTRARSS